MNQGRLQADQTKYPRDNLVTSAQSKAEEQPKKHFPSFWRIMKHPSPNSLSPELSADPLKALTDQQRETYHSIFNTLNSPGFELPNSSSSSQYTNTKSSSPQSLPVSPKLTEIEKCYCSRECLLRVCRATGWDSNRALKRLVDTLIWRRDLQVDQMDYEELWDAAEPGVELTLGYDNRQRPLLYMFPSKQTVKPTWNQIKLLVWYLERAIDLMPPGVETLTLMIDFGGPGKNSNSPPTSISTAKEVLKILQTYYCERLGQAICVNVPWIFWGFFKVLKPFLDTKTAEKILFDPKVTNHVPADQLIKEGFGGDLEFKYDHGTYYPLLAELAANRRQRMMSRYKRLANGTIGLSEYELRGGARRSKNRREMSIGSETTATDTQMTHPGSPTEAKYELRRGSKAGEASSQSPTGILFRLSPPQTSALMSNSEGSRTRSAVGPRKTDQLTDHNHSIVASRPFSINSLSSSPLVLPTSIDPTNVQKKAGKRVNRSSCLFHNDSKLSYSNPPILTHSQRPPSCSAYMASLSPTTQNHSTTKQRSFHSQILNHHHQSGHQNFDFHSLMDLSRDEHGRVQTDSMSLSRRIHEVST